MLSTKHRALSTSRELSNGVVCSAVGSAALSPALGVANLAAGLLNLGLAGYNTYQLRGISKQQKVGLAPLLSASLSSCVTA